MEMVNEMKIKEVKELEKDIERLHKDISLCQSSIGRRTLMKEVDCLEDILRKTKIEAMFK